MKKKAAYFIVGTLVLFIAIFAPLFTLAAWLTSNPVWGFLVTALLLSIPAFFSIWYTLNSSHNMTIRWIWMQALGLGTVLLSLVVLASLFTIRANPRDIGLVVLFAWPLLSAVAIWQALHIKTQYLRFTTNQLAAPLRLVQISDVHIGSRSPKFLDSVVASVNKQQPNIVVITGDLLDSSTVTETHLAALAKIACPTYMCIGNHERYVDLDKALAAISAHGVHILRDETVATHGIQLIGLDDRDKPDLLPSVLDELAIDQNCFSILLYHRPDGWQAALDKGIDLTLAGHTHAGQMFPFGFLVKRQYPNMAGLFTQEGRSLFVSTGTGTWGPIFRLGTRSELTVIDLDNESDLIHSDGQPNLALKRHSNDESTLA